MTDPLPSDSTSPPSCVIIRPAAPPSDMTDASGRPNQNPDVSETTLSGDHMPVPDYDRMFRKFHHHTISDSTSTTGSNDSSPTTVYSVVDDSSATEPSPGSSPESPPPTTFAVGMLRPRTADDSRSPFFELQKQPPPRKGRNLKNLAVNTSRPSLGGPVTGALPAAAARPNLDPSSILSPSFVKPPTPPKRKANNLGLTILTPAAGKLGPQDVKLSIPATPGFGRPGTLRHFQSSPSLPLVTNIGLAPLPTKERKRPHPLETILSPIEGPRQPLTPRPEEEEQNFDIPLSREEKPEAYPDGPLCIYDPNVDLYLEPTAEEAMKYDVVMNVASEVRNPFETYSDPDPTHDQLRIDGGGGIQQAPRRDHLTVTNPTEDAGQPARDASPTTPKATPLNATFPQNASLDTSSTSTLPAPAEPDTSSSPSLPAATALDHLSSTPKRPEYIHIKWEHNSDIVPDLLRLVKLIEERSNAGKRVLVHCQCGVSRSASLLVAYGLYLNPEMTVQEAYNNVKKRSKWIGPNMNLIMQLQEFRSSLARGGILSPDRNLSPTTPNSALSEWGGPFSERKRPAPPMTAVVPPVTEVKSVEELAALSGPSSAPSGFPWPLADQPVSSPTTPENGLKSPATYVDPAGHVIPVLKLIAVETPIVEESAPLPASDDEPGSTTPTAPVPHASTPQSAEFSMAPVVPPAEANPYDSFGILSPTSTEFATSPWDRSALLASLGMGSMQKDEETPRRSLQLQARPTQVQDAESIQPPAAKTPLRKLRPRISSPTLREQQHLQSLQAKIQATLPTRTSPAAQLSTLDEALMSPRATEFTSNPFALAFPTTLANPIDQNPGYDPRSPAQKGASPITRNILDFL